MAVSLLGLMWTGDQAYKEMRARGFSLPLLRAGMKNYLFKYARSKAETGDSSAAANPQQGSPALNH